MPDKHQIWRDTFSIFDEDGNGKLDNKELGKLMRSLGTCPSEKEIEDLIEEFDGGSGKLSYSEFEKLMEKGVSDPDTAASITESFRVFDIDQNGYMDKEELTFVMTSLGEKISKEELNEVFAMVDLEGNGRINYAELAKMVNVFDL